MEILTQLTPKHPNLDLVKNVPTIILSCGLVLRRPKKLMSQFFFFVKTTMLMSYALVMMHATPTTQKVGNASDH